MINSKLQIHFLVMQSIAQFANLLLFIKSQIQHMTFPSIQTNTVQQKRRSVGILRSLEDDLFDFKPKRTILH